MNILISGGTGFVGRFLIPALLKEGYAVTVLTRNKSEAAQKLGRDVKVFSWEELKFIKQDDVDVVINLAGENIGERYWTQKIKRKILDSRVQATRQLVAWILQAPHKKIHLYQASAVGIYGAYPGKASFSKKFIEEDVMETHHHYPDFLTEVGMKWEQETKKLSEAHFPVTIMRFGVVIKKNEGMMKKLFFPYYAGLGATLGSGEQALSWIHIDDLVAAILFLLKHPHCVGAYNLCAPECVSQQLFSKTFARRLKRPHFLALPAWVIQLGLGQMGKELLLSGQQVSPEKIMKEGFVFSYPALSLALQKEFEKQ